MKIGITCYPTYGGSGVVGTELGIEMADRGHEVHFICSSMPMRLRPSKLIAFHEVEVMSYPLFQYPPYDLALATQMAEVAESAGLDLLHVHYAIPHSVCAYLARGMMAPRKLPFITTLHGTDITLVGINSSYLGITRFAIEQSDSVTAISRYLRDKTYEEFEIKNNIEVIYNFVNCDKYRRTANPAYRQSYAPDGEKIVVHLSNFRPVKRVTEVVEIFALVHEKVPSKLLLIGDGPDHAAAEHLAHKRGVHDHTFFLGKQDNVEEILGIADVLLLPSEMEAFGLAALEAMACEVVPVATRVGGVPELVTHGADGFLAEVGDVPAMADYCARLLQSPDLLAEMSRAARQTAMNRFCTSLIIPQYENLYRRVLEASGSAPAFNQSTC
ncbi:MAG: N-acetyl-alpha-D-glucosaminyl L-malate synthase BshA [Acidobacteria bacterium]|nr:N-acetyl-alpha-D-glucosaminyl L-malate synthase BshA [Acidobacteriota bacterium]